MKWVGMILASVPGVFVAAGAEEEYTKEIEPLLEYYCYDCHGDGSDKGDVSLDGFDDLGAHLGDRDLWLRVWKYVRTDLMPPSDEEQPEAGERRKLLSWIERRVLELDPENPDPGRVTIRRLNRVEYQHTISDLVGVDYSVTDNFPPDDTGYGFDTIGDVLSLSPLLLEKYLAAAEEIAEMALPEDAGTPEPRRLEPGNFREPGNNNQTARFMEAEIEHLVRAEGDAGLVGTFQLEITYFVEGQGRARGHTAEWSVWLDGKELERREIRWDRRGEHRVKERVELAKGPHRLEFKIEPREPAENPDDKMGVRVAEVLLRGPEGASAWDHYPESYKRIFFKGPAPKDGKGRAEYARAIIERFAARAFRRPAGGATVDRLTKIALAKSGGEGATFEDGIKLAMTAVLASPRFLFRGEVQPEPDNPAKVVPLDEDALASRLSYFLWSSTPDEELMELAREGRLRAQLDRQVDRMLADRKSDRFVKNFVGQWLQARDVEGLNLDTRRILRIGDRREANRVFSPETRKDMRRETELFFEHVLRENRPAIELLTADYSFLNDRLARFYGVRDVRGREFRKVRFDDQTRARGGVLGQGTFLIVTSNPTRTSPVKRGLFVLDNILGTPAPPAPADVPELDEAREAIKGEPTMRQMMELHREKPLCKSCHARMDPIGLALENFNALGQWRDREGGQPIDTAGELITGEKFGNVMELKEILGSSRRRDFHRCLTEKLLTYALGRGVEYYDAPTVDKIVNGLETRNRGLGDLIREIVKSAPFQKRRGDAGG